MSEELIGRRKALKYFGMLSATAAGREFLASWLPSASTASAPTDAAALHGAHRAASQAAAPAKPYVPQFFKPEEFETVGILTEMIIPTDDKPGAKEAEVARYIDFVVFAAAEFQPELQKEWSRGLALLEELTRIQFGHAFRETSATDREALLTAMSLPERERNAIHPGYEFYRLVKEMTVEGFYTSRVGLVGVLEYQGLAFLAEFPGCTHPEHQ